MATKYKRGKSNKANDYNKRHDPKHKPDGKPSAGISSGYTPSKERLEREAREAKCKSVVVKPKHNNRGTFKDKSSKFWDTLDENTVFKGKTDWDKIKHYHKKSDDGVTVDAHAEQGEPDTYWNTLGDDIEYLGDTDWSAFRKKIKVVVEADVVTECTNAPLKTKEVTKHKRHHRNVGKSKSSAVFNIRKCKKCMRDCEYSAYLCGLPTNRHFAINKSTCPKR